MDADSIQETFDMTRIFALVLAAMIGFSGLGCTTNPATGQQQFNMLSTSQEIEIGSEASPQFLDTYGGPIPSQQIISYVSNLGAQLAAQSERPDLPWEFNVVDSSVINAFALPGGKVFISRGLLVKMTNEAQLAGVLGHEIGHVTAQHIGQQMSRQQIVQAVIAVGAATAGQDYSQYVQLLGGVAGQGYLLKYGRDQESQADDLGLRYMSRLGYNPYAQLQVLEILRDASGGASPPEFLSTHPAPDTRLRRVKAILDSEYSSQRNAPYYAERFKQTVLDELNRLPDAKHNG